MPNKEAKDAESLRALLDKKTELLIKQHPEVGNPCSVHELVVASLTAGGVEEDKIEKTLQTWKEDYVDWNELRVVYTAELARTLDPLEDADKLAHQVKELLGRIFEQSGNMTLEHLREMKISEARKALAQVESVSREVADRILTLEVEGANIPFTDGAVDLAKRWGIIPKSGTKQNLQKLMNDTLEHSKRARLAHYMEVHAGSGCKKTKCPVCK